MHQPLLEQVRQHLQRRPLILGVPSSGTDARSPRASAAAASARIWSLTYFSAYFWHSRRTAIFRWSVVSVLSLLDLPALDQAPASPCARSAARDSPSPGRTGSPARHVPVAMRLSSAAGPRSPSGTLFIRCPRWIDPVGVRRAVVEHELGRSGPGLLAAGLVHADLALHRLTLAGSFCTRFAFIGKAVWGRLRVSLYRFFPGSAALGAGLS